MIFSLAMACLLALASILLGLALLRFLKIPRKDPISIVCLSFALGFATLGNLYMLLGFFHLLQPLLLWAIPAVVVLGAFAFYRQLGQCLAEMFWVARGIAREQTIWTAAALAFLAIYLCRGLLPPTGIDELMYHLSVPQLYLDHGGFYRVFFNPQANLVMLTEMNYLPILATGNATGCKLLGFFIGLQLTLAVGLSARAFFGSRLGLPGMVVFLSLTNTVASFSTCNVDFTMTLFAVLAFTLLFSAESRPERVLGILLLGFCVQSKGIGFFSAVAIVLAGFITRPSQWKTWLACAIVPGLFGAPWLLKSMIYGNPHTAPMLAQTGLTAAVLEKSASLLVAQAVRFCVDLLGRIAAAPWSLSLFPDRHRMDAIGPLFLVLLPLLLAQRPKRAGAGPLIVFVAAYVFCLSFFELAVWGDASIRYFSPALALLCPAAVFAWTHGSSLHKSIRFLTTSCIAATVALSLVICAKRYRQEIASALTFRPQREYLLACSPEYPVMDYANRHLSHSDTILTTTCFGTYYLRIPYLCAFENYENRSSLMSGMKKLGVKYMLENDVLATGPLGPPADYLRPVFEQGSFRLSKLVAQ